MSFFSQSRVASVLFWCAPNYPTRIFAQSQNSDVFQNGFAGHPRDRFPDTLYDPFALNFQAAAGQTYEFRVFWYFAPRAPRLTQHSVMVQPQE
jgi:hypothetical protein